MTITPEQLPPVRGRIRANVSLAETTWFRVGGQAEWVFKPADAEDLEGFIRALAVIPRLDRGIQPSEQEPVDPAVKPRGDGSLPITILGAASNVVVRDGGIDGVLVRLGRGFNQLSGVSCQESIGGLIEAGAANLDVNVAQFALQHSLTGLEFLSGIPGGIGGAVRMNAGAYGSEIKDVLERAEVIFPDGTLRVLENAELGFAYRHCSLPEGAIVTRVWLRAEAGAPEAIAARMEEIRASREGSQPVRARTGGSTFRNPEGHKAWELIDAAGLRGTLEGGAKVSEKHCNFLINTGNATAADLERLVNRIIRQVKEHSGITLVPEIKFIGKAE
jgi:UDP-N-acetylmuramate dehydrogenase